MAQKLILSLNDTRVSASWKWGCAYEKEYGGIHYGQDMYGSSIVYANGDGYVVGCGWDNVCGNVVIVQYDDALNHFDGGSCDVIARYFHLAGISVKKGQKVNKDTRLGIVGDTGTLTDGVHLHIEFDRDTDYPYHTPTISRDSNFLKAGLRGNKDTTIDPMRLLHCKKSGPDCQKIRTANSADWVDPRDAQIPQIN